MKFRLLIGLLFFSTAVFAQKPAQKLVQFSGVTLNRDSNTAVPYVSISNKTLNDKLSYIANYKGYFSFVVHEGDTLQFSAVGFGKQQVIIPTGLPDDKYTVLVKLKQA